MKNGKIKKEGGSGSVEFAFLFPILTVLLLGIVQLMIFIQSAIATQYAAYLAARAYQVYGTRKLEEIKYKHVESEPYTNPGQSIAEAAAEKVLFESLRWEQRKIKVIGDNKNLDRVYKDGNDLSQSGISENSTEGSVRLSAMGDGVRVTYCVPIFAPGLSKLFALAVKNYPCKNTRGGFGNVGLMVTREARFGREPEVEQ
jgi:hypothetical protein